MVWPNLIHEEAAGKDDTPQKRPAATSTASQPVHQETPPRKAKKQRLNDTNQSDRESVNDDSDSEDSLQGQAHNRVLVSPAKTVTSPALTVQTRAAVTQRTDSQTSPGISDTSPVTTGVATPSKPPPNKDPPRGVDAESLEFGNVIHSLLEICESKETKVMDNTLSILVSAFEGIQNKDKINYLLSLCTRKTIAEVKKEPPLLHSGIKEKKDYTREIKETLARTSQNITHASSNHFEPCPPIPASVLFERVLLSILICDHNALVHDFILKADKTADPNKEAESHAGSIAGSQAGSDDEPSSPVAETASTQDNTKGGKRKRSYPRTTARAMARATCSGAISGDLNTLRQVSLNGWKHVKKDGGARNLRTMRSDHMTFVVRTLIHIAHDSSLSPDGEVVKTDCYMGHIHPLLMSISTDFVFDLCGYAHGQKQRHDESLGDLLCEDHRHVVATLADFMQVKTKPPPLEVVFGRLRAANRFGRLPAIASSLKHYWEHGPRTRPVQSECFKFGKSHGILWLMMGKQITDRSEITVTGKPSRPSKATLAAVGQKYRSVSRALARERGLPDDDTTTCHFSQFSVPRSIHAETSMYAPLWDIKDESEAKQLRSKNFLPLEAYATEAVTSAMLAAITERVENRNFTSLEPHQLGKHPQIQHFICPCRLNGSNDTEDEEAPVVYGMVFVINNFLSEEMKEVFRVGNDELPYAAPGKDYHQGPNPKSRYYRASSCRPGGAIQVGKRMYGVVPLTNEAERIMLQITSEIIEMYRDIIRASNDSTPLDADHEDGVREDETEPERSNIICCWPIQNFVLQGTCGTMDDSPYKVHDDLAITHNHFMDGADLWDDDDEDIRERLLILPPSALVLVFTFVFCSEGHATENARVTFQTKPEVCTKLEGGSKIVGSYVTTDCSLSVQLSFVNHMWQHGVENLDKTGKGAVRIVHSLRYSLDGSHFAFLRKEAAQNQETLRALEAMHKNYTIYKVPSTLAAGKLLFPETENAFTDENQAGLSIKPVEVNYEPGPVDILESRGLGPVASIQCHSGSIPPDRERCVKFLKTNFFKSGLKTMEDSVPFYERLKSAPVLRLLHKQRIELVLEHTTYDSDGRKTVQEARYSKPRKMPVVKNWFDPNSLDPKSDCIDKKWADMTEDDETYHDACRSYSPCEAFCLGPANREEYVPEEEDGHLVPGAIVRIKALRSACGLPDTAMTNPTWRTSHPSMMDTIITPWMYKNQYIAIGYIVSLLVHGMEQEAREKGYWVGGCGGSTVSKGHKPAVLKSRSQTDLPAECTMVLSQKPNTKENTSMRMLHQGNSVTMNFVPLCNGQPVGRDGNTYAMCLGYYSTPLVVSGTEKPPTVRLFIDGLRRIFPGDETKSQHTTWLHGVHFKNHQKPAFEIDRESLTEPWTSIKIDVSSPQANAPVRYYMQPVPKEEKHYLDDISYNRMRLAEESVIAGVFEKSLLPDLLESGGISMEKQMDARNNFASEAALFTPGGKVQVSRDALIGAVARVGVAGAFRFKRQSVHNVASSGPQSHNRPRKPRLLSHYLDDAYAHSGLGPLVRSTPLPMPCRELDKASCFLGRQLLASHAPLFTPNGSRGQHDVRVLQRYRVADMDSKLFAGILFNSVMFRSTGNEEPLRCYFEFVGGGSAKYRDGVVRCFQKEDILLLSSYMAAVGDLSRAGKASSKKSSKGVGIFVNPQFSESIYPVLKHSPSKWAQFFDKLWEGLQNSTQLAELQHPKDRDQLVKALADMFGNIQDTLLPGQKRVSHFFAHKIVCDLEMCMCGAEGDHSPPFPTSNQAVFLGWGGEMGAGVYHDPDTPTEMQTGETPGEEAGELLDGSPRKALGPRKRLLLAAKDIMKFMRETASEALLALFGMQRLEVSDGEKVVVMLYNWREMDVSDVEHWFCKVYLWVDRTRGGRSSSVPNPSSLASWPSYREDTISDDNLEVLMSYILENFEGVTDLPDLEDPFLMKGQAETQEDRTEASPQEGVERAGTDEDDQEQ